MKTYQKLSQMSKNLNYEILIINKNEKIRLIPSKHIQFSMKFFPHVYSLI